MGNVFPSLHLFIIDCTGLYNKDRWHTFLGLVFIIFRFLQTPSKKAISTLKNKFKGSLKK